MRLFDWEDREAPGRPRAALGVGETDHALLLADENGKTRASLCTGKKKVSLELRDENEKVLFSKESLIAAATRFPIRRNSGPSSSGLRKPRRASISSVSDLEPSAPWAK